MSGDIKFELVLAGPKRSYQGGDYIYGHVYVDFSEATKVRGRFHCFVSKKALFVIYYVFDF